MPRRNPAAGAVTGRPVVVVGAGTGPAVGSVPVGVVEFDGAGVPQLPSLPLCTHTSSRLERTELGASAFRACVPVWLNVIEALPWASVVFPPTLAPAMAAPLPPSVTLAVMAWP